MQAFPEKILTLPKARIRHPQQGTVYLAIPQGLDPQGLSAVVAVHGSGRGALDYRDTPFYQKQRDIALSHGYLFAAVSNGPDTWGLDHGLANVKRLCDYLISTYSVKKPMLLWATSAGGTLAYRMVMEYPQYVSCVLGTFPVYDLAAGFSLASCQRAWETENAEEFLHRIEGRNPAQFPEKLRDHSFFLTHGGMDTAVPLDLHSRKLQAQVGENVHLQVIPKGVHGTADFSYYGETVELAFEYDLNQKRKGENI